MVKRKVQSATVQFINDINYLGSIRCLCFPHFFNSFSIDLNLEVSLNGEVLVIGEDHAIRTICFVCGMSAKSYRIEKVYLALGAWSMR